MKSDSALLQSLDLLAGRVGDPVAEIYARLFAACPKLEALFSMDMDGGVRGSMVAQAFECLIDLAEGPGILAHTIIAAERANHDAYDVPEGMFEVFFAIIRDVTKEAAGSDWSASMEAAWTSVLQDARRPCQPLPA